MKLCRLRWLGHVVRMANLRLPQRALICVSPTEWKKPPGSEQMTWQRGMKKRTADLGSVGISGLLGWGPKSCQLAGWGHLSIWQWSLNGWERAVIFYQIRIAERAVCRFRPFFPCFHRSSIIFPRLCRPSPCSTWVFTVFVDIYNPVEGAAFNEVCPDIYFWMTLVSTSLALLLFFV